MMQSDRVLEGVRGNEVERLRALAEGATVSQDLTILEAKGWVETIGGVPLITLTGRTLLERASVVRR